VSAIEVEWLDGRVLRIERVGGEMVDAWGYDATRYASVRSGVACAGVSAAPGGRCAVTRAGRYQSHASVGRILGRVRLDGLPLSWGEVWNRRLRALAAEGRVTLPDGPASW